MTRSDRAYIRQKIDNIDAYLRQLEFALDDQHPEALFKVAGYIQSNAERIQKRVQRGSQNGPEFPKPNHP